MQLSRFSDYALRSLMYLACHPDRPVAVGEISQAYGISFHHLAKVTQALTRAGWAEAHRGRSGGLRLVVEPEALTVAEVIRQMEPSLALVECFDPDRDQCRIRRACGLRHALERAREAFFSELERTTLADLVEPRSELIQLLMTVPQSSERSTPSGNGESP